jgi:cytochrome c peroxidase
MTRLIAIPVGFIIATLAKAAPLGLPEVPVPADNPQTDAKVALGEKLFNDKRFSSTGEVSCANCHARDKAFTDHLRVSEGISKLTGTRNAPTVINAAYMKTLFWDGREPDLEGQSKQPFLNPVEMGLPSHQPILDTVRNDAEYQALFKQAFDKGGDGITMDDVAHAIAAFERTQIAGDTPFDRYRYAGQTDALTDSQKRGLALFTGKARCVSCHVIEQAQALFTDNRFHNIGVGFKRIHGQEAATAASFIQSKRQGANVDFTVLTKENMSELGRFAVTEDPTQVGAFKTPTLRNIAVTQPYMHDGSLKSLNEVVDFYNNGGRLKKDDPLSDFLSGGIRPLNLDDAEKKDLVAFLEALTSPQYAQPAADQTKGGTP